MSTHILIAEDEPYIVESLGFVLTHAGYTVSAVRDGQAVLAAVTEQKPALLILDLMLPNKSGFEVLKQLRSDPQLASMPVMMLTAKGQEQDRSTAEHLGVDAFMTKPFSNREVVECVNKLVNRQAVL